MSHAVDRVKLQEELRRPLPLYSRVMRKYIVQTNLDLLRRRIRCMKQQLADDEAQLEVSLNGITGSGDVTLIPSDVFTHDKGRENCIDDPVVWETILEHFRDHGATGTDLDDMVHTLRCRTNVVRECKERALPLPPGFVQDCE